MSASGIHISQPNAFGIIIGDHPFILVTLLTSRCNRVASSIISATRLRPFVRLFPRYTEHIFLSSPHMGDLDMKAVRNAMTSRVDDLTTTKTMTMTTTPSPPPVASSTSQRTGKSAPRCRIMFTREQLAQLEKYFDRDRYPKIRERRRIAEAMAITERRVQVT